MKLSKKVVLISGASGGIGKAMAFAFAKEGARVVLGARRLARLAEIKQEIENQNQQSVLTLPLDVCNSKSVEEFVKTAQTHFGSIDILLNNAGLALGKEPLIQTQEEDWHTMLNTNVMGVLRLSKAVIPHMLDQKQGGQIINLGSIAGHFTYPGGVVYCASKHALRAITQTLRQELVGKPIRISSIDPGMVKTEFSIVRFQGNEQKAAQVYEGFTPLSAEDIAECAVFLANRPAHVNIDEIIVTPLAQAGTQVIRDDRNNQS